MTIITLIIETESGERFLADVHNFEAEKEIQRRGNETVKQVRYEVGTMVNAKTGEEM